MTDTIHRLLIIEDNDADVFLINRALQENSIRAEVTVCGDGESAVRTLNSSEMMNPPMPSSSISPFPKWKGWMLGFVIQPDFASAVKAQPGSTPGVTA